MENLLISIKPEYVHRILSGEKKYEFRRTIFKRDVEKIFIYSTSPEMKIVGYFEYDGVVEDTPINLWERFHDCSGIPEEDFFDYYKGKDTGYAIRIGKLHVFDESFDVKNLEKFRAPQSFQYVSEDFLNDYE